MAGWRCAVRGKPGGRESPHGCGAVGAGVVGGAVACGQEGVVEPGHAVGQGAEVAQQDGGQAGGEGERGGQFGPPVELLELEVVGGGGGGEGLQRFGEALEAFALEGAEELLQGFVIDDGEEGFGVGGDGGAEGVEFFGAGHVDAAGDADVLVGELEVEASAGVAGEQAMGEGGADVGFVGGFVHGETGVAVEAVDGFGGLVGDVVGGEGAEGVVEEGDELDHGGADGGVEGLFARGEPVAVVVAFEAAEKGGHVPGEAGEAWGCHRGIVGGIRFGRAGPEIQLGLERRA
jgi:hypothetical protein